MLGLLVAVVFFIIALRRSLRAGLAVVIASILLVPNTLVVPLSPTSIITVQRLTAIALLINILMRIRRRGLSPRIFAMTPVHAVFVLMLAVAFAVGVVLAQPTVSVTDSSHIWANYLGEFVVFVIVLAAIRAIGDTTFVVRALAVVLLITAFIAIIEHLTGGSYAQLFFRRSGQSQTGPANVLQQRGGLVRARVASGYSLDYAWVAASLVPVFLVAALGRVRRWWVVGAGLFVVLLAIYWTRSRSMAIAIVICLLALAVIGRSRRVAQYSITTLVLMAGVYLASSSVSHTLSAAAGLGSIDVRFARIPSIAAFVAPHAFGGLGFTGVADLGFQAVDSSYILLYGDIGVIGLTMFLLLYATGAITSARGVLAQDTRQRLIAAAATLGVLTLIGAGFTYDSTTQLDAQYLLWVLAALGIVVAEQTVGAPRWFAVPSFTRIAAVVTATAVGFFIYVAAPTHYATTFTFTTLSPATEFQSDPADIGSTLIKSVCNIAASDEFHQNGVSMTCQDPNAGLAPLAVLHGNTIGGPGQGELRVQAHDPEAGLTALTDFTRAVHSVRELGQVRLHVITPLKSGRPTPLRTAPVWLPMIVGMAALMFPRRRRKVTRRNVPRQSDSAEPELRRPLFRLPVRSG
jgi:hypothetical protein